ncbi:hypothetical protein AOXY_G32040 [Acipenser oxyrinchus oxyrinchus]|uniref:Ig-like domain-containing protein n=1 Tax=Acipenser oxyrinchus oxyrinchus TaxID=40147 RepID=A0AAD8CHX1_ACIOX|nr:hypothetical protein AOXY_G32040 [Acipenser oxyrinchus oxyrinchus]
MNLIAVLWFFTLIAGYIAVEAGVTVLQLPYFLRVTEGLPASLHCAVSSDTEQPPRRYLWYRAPAAAERFNASGTMPFSSHVSGTESRGWDRSAVGEGAWLRIQETKLSDAGLFYCVVERSNGETVFGNGTQIRVEVNRCLNSPVAILNGAKIFLILVVTIELCALAVCRKKKLPPLRHQNNSNRTISIVTCLL